MVCVYCAAMPPWNMIRRLLLWLKLDQQIKMTTVLCIVVVAVLIFFLHRESVRTSASRQLIDVLLHQTTQFNPNGSSGQVASRKFIDSAVCVCISGSQVGQCFCGEILQFQN
jgi:hypothetical protein